MLELQNLSIWTDFCEPAYFDLSTIQAAPVHPTVDDVQFHHDANFIPGNNTGPPHIRTPIQSLPSNTPTASESNGQKDSDISPTPADPTLRTDLVRASSAYQSTSPTLVSHAIDVIRRETTQQQREITQQQQEIARLKDEEYARKRQQAERKRDEYIQKSQLEPYRCCGRSSTFIAVSPCGRLLCRLCVADLGLDPDCITLSGHEWTMVCKWCKESKTGARGLPIPLELGP
jgi:hypothetical protein